MNANEKRKPTIEHLQPKSLGGGNDLENLRLCHPGCNNALGNRPHANKERMRDTRATGAARSTLFFLVWMKLAMASHREAK